MNRRQSSSIKLILLGMLVLIALTPIYGLKYHWFSKAQPITVSVAPHLTTQQFAQASANLNATMKQKGMPATFNYVSNQINSNPSFARDCHPLLHQLGHEAFSYFGGYTEAIKYQNEICDSGYTHGVLEAYLSNAPNLIQALQSACNTTQDQNFSQWQCYHGLGHGIMLASKENIQKSISICSTFSSTFASSACYNGVFMEHFVVTDHDGNVPKNNPTSLNDCASQPNTYKSDCYTYAPTAFLTINSGQYVQALKWCNSSETGYIETCVGGVGSQTMKDNINNPGVAEKVCKSAQAIYRDNCVSGAVNMFIYFKGSTSGAKDLCQNTFADNQTACLSAINSAKTEFSI